METTKPSILFFKILGDQGTPSRREWVSLGQGEWGQLRGGPLFPSSHPSFSGLWSERGHAGDRGGQHEPLVKLMLRPVSALHGSALSVAASHVCLPPAPPATPAPSLGMPALLRRPRRNQTAFPLGSLSLRPATCRLLAFLSPTVRFTLSSLWVASICTQTRPDIS